jgi:DNA primase
MSSIDEIKARIDIVDLVSETVQLRRSGKNYTGFCPFHSNTRTPAFVVFPESGTWRCFGQCNEGGDIFRFVMKKEGWDFSEALRNLAERAGVQLKPQTPQELVEAEEHSRLRSLLEDATTFFQHNLRNSTAGQAALVYLHQRGLRDETIEAFGLGYAPMAWDAVLNHFLGKGFSEQELIDTGLVTERQPDASDANAIRRVYDRFRHRIIIPIRDERGRMTGFGARILNPEDIPKFLNSPQTALFDKSRLLYGLDRARKSIRDRDQVVLVEGYLDVIALHQAGFTNTVSPMGTAINEAHLRLLKRYSRRIILAMDSDAAGDKATLRGLEIARQAMDHATEAVFDARGLLSYEARLQADLRVTTLPPGMDPDDIVNRDPQEWEHILEAARPVVIHVMETLAAGRDLDDPKIKTEIARQVLPLIEDIPEPLERDTYRQRLARLLRVDERSLLGDSRVVVKQTRRGRRTTGVPEQPIMLPGTLSGEGRVALEGHCLGVLMRRPDLVYQVDRALQEDGLPRLAISDFERADHQTIFSLIQESLEQNAGEPLNFILNHLSLPLMDHADQLLERTGKLDPNDVRVREDLLRAILELRRREVRLGLDYIRFVMEEAQQMGDLLVNEYQHNMLQYTQALNRIDRALGRYTSHLVPR